MPASPSSSHAFRPAPHVRAPARLRLRPVGARPPAAAGGPTPPWRRAVRDLLDAQLWCVGRDIQHVDGNALLRWGFARVRPPAGATGSSAYRLALADGSRCVLWGFAVWYGAPALGAGLLLHRHPFAARLTTSVEPPLPLWRAEQLALALPSAVVAPDRAPALAARLARAFAGYEAWALATLGAAHRRECERERPRGVRRRQPVPCEALADGWRALAERLAGDEPACAGARRREGRAS